jgi:hypothetical protein
VIVRGDAMGHLARGRPVVASTSITRRYFRRRLGIHSTAELELQGVVVPIIKDEPQQAENGGNTMRGSSLVWTIVGILVAIALIIWIVSAL